MNQQKNIPPSFQLLEITAQGAARSGGVWGEDPQRTKCKIYIFAGMLFAMSIALPFSVRAEIATDAKAAQPTMHFMKLPPRKMQMTFAQRQARPAMQARKEAEKDQPPPPSDDNKLLLYVYDEMR